MTEKKSQPRCSKCGICLSKTYPHALCPKCWQDKYHAPPGTNHFPPDKAATNRATPPIPEVFFPIQPPGARVSSQVSSN